MEEKNVEFWSLDELRAFAAETKQEVILGKMVEIKKLPSSVMVLDSSKNLFEIVALGLVKPKLNKEQIENLPIAFTKELVDVIMKFSSVDMETAEKK